MQISQIGAAVTGYNYGEPTRFRFLWPRHRSHRALPQRAPCDVGSRAAIGAGVPDQQQLQHWKLGAVPGTGVGAGWEVLCVTVGTL